MSDEIYYNRRDWLVPVLSSEILQKLDDRYVNADEVIKTNEIELLYVKYITMIDPVGYIEYPDGSRQYSAVNDNLNNDNIYTGSNTYNGMTIYNGESVFNGESKLRSFFIEDGVNNKKSKIYQQGNILIIDNNNQSSSCYIQLYDANGLSKRFVFDAFGNLSGLNDLRVLNRVFIGSTAVIRQSGNLLTFDNMQNNTGFSFLVRNSSGVPRQVIIGANGALSGLTEADIFNVIGGNYFFESLVSSIKMSKIGFNLVIENRLAGGLILIQLNPSNDGLRIDEFINVSGINNLFIKGKITFSNSVEHYFSNQFYVIDNKNNASNIEIRNYDATGVMSKITIDFLMNMSGIRDISMEGTLRINNLIEHKIEYLLGSSNYVIDNKNNGSSIEIRCYDNGAVMKKITIDPFMNMTGINDLYVERIFFGGIVFNPASINDINTKTSQISYTDNNVPQQTRILKQSSQRGVLIVPDAMGGNYNGIVQTNDTAIVLANNSANANGALTLTNWSSTLSGIRVKSNETEAYNLKVMDGGLKFQDNTVQTTAMTNAYLTTLIQSVVSQMSLTVPVGTILPYGGLNAPPGYYLCDGSLKTIFGNSNLFSVIGHSFYVEGRTLVGGHFFMPDLRGAYLKGCGTSNMWENTTPILEPGWKQNDNVGRHAHKYVDRGVDTRSADASSFNQFVKPSNDTYWTDGLSYHSTTREVLDAENRPNSIGVNYIIKF